MTTLKYLILLLVCAPFLWLIYADGNALAVQYGLVAPPGALPSDAADKLKAARAAAADTLKTRAAVGKAIVLVSEEPPAEGGAPGSHLDAVARHAKALAEAREAATLWHEMADKREQDLARWNQHLAVNSPYFPILKERHDALGRIRATRDELDSRLDGLRNTLAARLPQLDKDLAAVVPNLRGELQRAVKDLKDLKISEFKAWAEAQLVDWDEAERLLDLATSARKLIADRDPDCTVDDLFRKVSQVRSKPKLSAAFRNLTRNLYLAFCNRYMVSSLDLGEHVLVGKEDSPATVRRSDLDVIWKGPNNTPGKAEPFKDSGLNGFSPSTELDRVFAFSDKSLGASHPVVLKPTVRATAAKIYNDARKNIAWTREDIDRLTKTCRPHAKSLDNWSRIETLHAAAEQAEGLGDDDAGGRP